MTTCDHPLNTQLCVQYRNFKEKSKDRKVKFLTLLRISQCGYLCGVKSRTFKAYSWSDLTESMSSHLLIQEFIWKSITVIQPGDISLAKHGRNLKAQHLKSHHYMSEDCILQSSEICFLTPFPFKCIILATVPPAGQTTLAAIKLWWVLVVSPLFTSVVNMGPV